MSNKLDFCPYEFEKLGVDTPEDLAYELVFCGDYSIEDLQSTSIKVGGGDMSFIQIGKDPRLEKYYQDESIHYMLQEGIPDLDMPSGLSQLLLCMERGNSVLSEFYKKSDVEYERTENKDGVQDNVHKYGHYHLKCEREKNGNYIFRYASRTRRDRLMEAVPCCPSCHKRLPVGWMEAKDFCGISLMAKKGGGKTTFLLSLMVDNWRAVRYISQGWHIASAHARNDASYEELVKHAKDIVLRKKCPPRTRVKKLISPIFLNIDYKGKKMIAGLYDNSGEVLYEMEPTDPRAKMLKYMYAHIYLIEPEQMQVKLRDKKEKMDPERKLEVSMPHSREKGGRQKSCQGMKILEDEPLKKTDTDVLKMREDPLMMYSRYKDLLENDLDRLKKQYFCTTIIKCDLLEGLKEIEAISRSKDLFVRKQSEINEDLEDAREWIVEKIFDKYVFVDNRQKEVLLEEFAGRVSWHCISALGCDTTERENGIFYLDGEYQPIRVAEPLVTCLKKKAEENGWYDEDSSEVNCVDEI